MEVCAEHSEIVRTQGEIVGKLEMILDGQKAMFTKLEGLVQNGEITKLNVAVEKQKLKPLFWFIASLFSAVLIVLADVLIRHWGK
jgi:hypothetical protein